MNFQKILPNTLTIKEQALKVGQGTCITLPYLNSKGKIIGGGEPPPPSILDKNSPIGIGLTDIYFMGNKLRTEDDFCINSSYIHL